MILNYYLIRFAFLLLPLKMYIVNDGNKILQSFKPLYIIQSHGKEYILKYTAENDSTIKKKWLTNIYIVKELNKSKYKNIPQARYGVLILVINDKKYPEAFKEISRKGVKEISTD